MRSDAAPRLDQSISPTWLGDHAFLNRIIQFFGNPLKASTPLCSYLNSATNANFVGKVTLFTCVAGAIASNGGLEFTIGGKFNSTGNNKQITLTANPLGTPLVIYDSGIGNFEGDWQLNVKLVNASDIALVATSCLIGGASGPAAPANVITFQGALNWLVDGLTLEFDHHDVTAAETSSQIELGYFHYDVV